MQYEIISDAARVRAPVCVRVRVPEIDRAGEAAELALLLAVRGHVVGHHAPQRRLLLLRQLRPRHGGGGEGCEVSAATRLSPLRACVRCGPALAQEEGLARQALPLDQLGFAGRASRISDDSNRSMQPQHAPRRGCACSRTPSRFPLAGGNGEGCGDSCGTLRSS